MKKETKALVLWWVIWLLMAKSIVYDTHIWQHSEEWHRMLNFGFNLFFAALVSTCLISEFRKYFKI